MEKGKKVEGKRGKRGKRREDERRDGREEGTRQEGRERARKDKVGRNVNQKESRYLRLTPKFPSSFFSSFQ